MATLVALLGGLVLFTAGAKIGHFILLGGASVLLVFHQIRDAQYRLARLVTFLNPGDGTTEGGFQIHQSLIGIGSGGLFGTGFGQGQQKLGYLPYAYSDFLFSTIGEEWGFVGVLAVVSLFALFCWLGFRIARTAADPFGQYLAVGLTCAIGLTAFMHMAVSLGLMPTTGLTLPFMSYGRSSQIISLLATGILINIGRSRGRPRASRRRREAEKRRRRGEGRQWPSDHPDRGRRHRWAPHAGAGDRCGARDARSGARARAGGRVRGVEARILPTRDYRYHLLPSEPIYRRQWWKNIRWPMLAGHLLRGVDELLQAERPAAVLGTGGYASAPVVWRAARGGLPTAIQEQNAYPGLATRWLSRRVRHVYLGLPESRRLLRFGSRTQVFDTGNPIVPPTPRAAPARAQAVRPGAQRSGAAGDRWQPGCAGDQSGGGRMAGGGRAEQCTHHLGHGPRHLRGVRPLSPPPRVQVMDYLDPMADGYAVADLVISRAGMMTVAELCAWGLPSILIPLPTAAADHQTHNARVLAEAGASLLLPQSELTPQRLGEVVEGVVSDDGTREAMAKQAMARGKPEAAKEIVSNLLTLVG